MTELSTATPAQMFDLNDTAQQPGTPSPLDIPELLDKIFSFVNESTLAFSVPFVCRKWFLLSQRLIIREAVIDTDMTNEELEGALGRLRVARRMYWFTHFMSGDEATRRLPQRERVAASIQEKHQRWEDLRAVGRRDSNADDNDRRHDKGVRWSVRDAPLQELIVVGKFMGFDIQLVHLLPFLSHLTVFRVETDFNCEVRLNAVFRACPLLQEVTIRPRQSAWNGDPFLDSDESSTSKFTAGEKGLLIHLQTFIIERCYVNTSTLQDFISAAPHLTDLQLIRIRAINSDDSSNALFHIDWFDNDDTVEAANNTLLDLIDFFERLTPPLPLNNFHLSAEAFSLETKNPNLLLKLCPGLASSISTDYLGFPDRSYNQLQQRLQLQTAPRNVITVLDLRAAFGKPPQHGDQLHYYLCESPHLLHLYAPKIWMRINHMDVYRRMWSTRLNEVSPIMGLVRPQPGIWACRKLRTLHMSFSYFSTNSSWIDSSDNPLDEPNDARKCRLLYGYISIVCPALVDLWMDVGSLVGVRFMIEANHLRLRMGFFLLTRLGWLERLAFRGLKPRWGREIPEMHDLEDVEVEWMQASMDEDVDGEMNEVNHSLERIKAMREMMVEQKWEYSIRLECERDVQFQEQHRQSLELFRSNLYLPTCPTTIPPPPSSRRPLFLPPRGVAIGGVVGGNDSGSGSAGGGVSAGADTSIQEVSIKFMTPQKCADYEEVLAKLENVGMLLDVKLLIEDMETQGAAYRVWPFMRHASIFTNTVCPFGRTIGQEFRGRHRPQRQ